MKTAIKKSIPACSLRPAFEAFWDGKERPNRKTSQKLAVLQQLYSGASPRTAQEIYGDVRQQLPTISKTTVYRTLTRLVEDGLAIQLRVIPELAHYERMREPHAHFVCELCRRIFDVPLTDPSPLHLSSIRIGNVRSASLVFHGQCRSCAISANE